MKLADRIKKLHIAVDGLTLRERLMLFAGVLVVAGGLWEALLAGPLEAREVILSGQIQTAKDRLDQLDQAMTLAAQGIGDGMPAHLERLRMLQQQVEATDKTVRVFTTDLVTPTQMRMVLEELIDRQRGLRLVRVGNLDVEPLLEQDDSAGAGESDEPMLYRHGLKLELEGSYLDCLEYLSTVERLPWKLYWGALDLRTEDYPRNAITIEIFTLSLDREWIGV
jgi:MSHA biogenesis protein MshJ